MSVTHVVFLARTRLPTRDVWAQAIRAHGFSVSFDARFEPTRDDGYVPCRYRGAEAGFEYFLVKADAYLAEQDLGAMRELGERDIAIELLTRSRVEDLATAVIAGAVLATIADGLMWSAEAGELIDAPLEHARDLDVEPVVAPAPAAAPALPSSVAVDLATRVVFRGEALTTLETLEAVPRRFTVKVGAREGEVRILAVWESPAGRPRVHRVRIGATIHELDPEGNPRQGRSIATLISQLGITESATRDLLAAGAAAVPGLCEVAGDARRPALLRRMAIVILGQLGERSATPTLAALAQDVDLGEVATRALAKLQTSTAS